MQLSRLNKMVTSENAEDNPALSNVIERNIRTIINLHLKTALSKACKTGSPMSSPRFLGA